jgi:hypothetical protein
MAWSPAAFICASEGSASALDGDGAGAGVEDAGGADGSGVGDASGAAAATGAVLVVVDGVGTDGVAA